MPEERATNEHFLALVQRFQIEAWLFLGKMVHPESQEVERNLGAAKHVIDSLGMLEEKTKGNLSSEEERFLKQVVTTLRLNFVDESNRKPEEAPAPAGEPAESKSEEADGTDEEETKQEPDASAS